MKIQQIKARIVWILNFKTLKSSKSIIKNYKFIISANFDDLKFNSLTLYFLFVVFSWVSRQESVTSLGGQDTGFGAAELARMFY